jgi:hypothetical protein
MINSCVVRRQSKLLPDKLSCQTAASRRTASVSTLGSAT